MIKEFNKEVPNLVISFPKPYLYFHSYRVKIWINVFTTALNEIAVTVKLELSHVIGFEIKSENLMSAVFVTCESQQ